MLKKYALTLFLLTSISGRISFAQESMITDVSYVFLEKLIATAKENYPRMKNFEKRMDIAKTDISREQLSWLDALSFSYVYNPNNTIDRVDPTLFNGYQVAFNVNLGALLQKPGNVKQARHAQQVAQLDLDEYNLSLEAEVKRRYFTYIQSLSLLKLQSKITEEALNVSKDVKIRYEKSETTYEQFSTSQISYSTASMSKITAESNYLAAKAALEELIAKRIEEVQ